MNYNSEHKKVYKNKRWESIRKSVLLRDEYLCQLCKKKGIMVDADTVHHINPVDERFDLRYDLSNLISLCESCHNKMHDRNVVRLSEDGERLRRMRDNKVKVYFVIGLDNYGKIKDRIEKGDLVYNEIMIKDNLNTSCLAEPYLTDMKKAILKRLEYENEINTAWIILSELKYELQDYYFYDYEVIG